MDGLIIGDHVVAGRVNASPELSAPSLHLLPQASIMLGKLGMFGVQLREKNDSEVIEKCKGTVLF